jgi:uncharacterized membrane protein YheB (UPF0754 family)
MCNKSLLTNIISLLVYVLSYFLPDPYYTVLNQMGIFALSGALTNWLAIHMLFEKVPFLYGSGIIEQRFDAFKGEMKRLVMQELFTESIVNKVISGSQSRVQTAITDLLDHLDYNQIYEELMQSILSSPLGAMLSMIGGAAALEPMRPSLVTKLREYFHQLAQSEQLQQQLTQTLNQQTSSAHLMKQVAHIIELRLAELTPKMVKDIMQRMIRDHLGWLVIWGGIFGAAVGLFNAILIR